VIIQENLTINGREFVHTYSDAGFYIKGGVPEGVYPEAYDPKDKGREYTETDEIIEEEPEDSDGIPEGGVEE